MIDLSIKILGHCRIGSLEIYSKARLSVVYRRIGGFKQGRLFFYIQDLYS